MKYGLLKQYFPHDDAVTTAAKKVDRFHLCRFLQVWHASFCQLISSENKLAIAEEKIVLCSWKRVLSNGDFVFLLPVAILDEVNRVKDYWIDKHKMIFPCKMKCLCFFVRFRVPHKNLPPKQPLLPATNNSLGSLLYTWRMWRFLFNGVTKFAYFTYLKNKIYIKKKIMQKTVLLGSTRILRRVL